MRLKLRRPSARLLLLLLAPVLLTIQIRRFLTGQSPKRRGRLDPDLLSTIDGDPLAYSGDQPVVVAFWSESTPVWKAAAFPALIQLQTEFGAACKFRYLEAIPDNSLIQSELEVSIIPTILVLHHGKEIARFVNVLSGGELRQVLADLVGRPAA
jgi:hypothetical protein